MAKKTFVFRANIDGLDDKPRWYTIVTNYNYEQKVAKDINKIAESNDMILEAFSGIKEIEEIKINKKGEEVKKPRNIKLLPNYVFVKTRMNPTIWSILSNITGVSAVLCLGGVPVFTEESKINKMKQQLND